MAKKPARVAFHRAAQAKCLEVAERIVEHIKTDGLVPVRTGRLRDSYHAEAEGSGAVVKTDADYWKYQEYGTRNTPAQPHVRPAYEAVRNER